MKLLRISTIPLSLNVFCRGQLKMMSEHYEVVAVSSPDKQLDEISEREGVRTIAVPMERHISLVLDMKSLIQLIKVFRQEKPDIVHSMTPKAGLLAMLAARITGVPVRMHTYTGLVFPTATGIKQKILIATDRLLCRCATYINPEGNGVAHDLMAYHITSKPLHIIGHGNVRGIDPDYWNKAAISAHITRDSLNIAEDDMVMLFVGRLVKDKGINELVNAFEQLKEKHVHVKLVLVGPHEDDLDPLLPETKRIIDNDSDIISVGAQKDVRPYYAISDLFVFPSYREGFPNTVLEAGAMGLPQIVTNINGSNEIIKDNLNGKIIVAPNHGNMENALFGAMTWFVEHPVERQRMANNARRMVIDRYNQQFIWGELLKVYQSFSK